MIGQIGPQKLLEQLKAQAPKYAQILPELPILLHHFLQRGAAQTDKATLELLAEQRRTNRLLQTLVAVVIGFVLGLVAMQIVARVRVF